MRWPNSSLEKRRPVVTELLNVENNSVLVFDREREVKTRDLWNEDPLARICQRGGKLQLRLGCPCQFNALPTHGRCEGAQMSWSLFSLRLLWRLTGNSERRV